QGVQWNTAFTIAFRTCDLSAVQATAHSKLDALGSHAHAAGHGHFHGTTEADTSFQLTGDAICHQSGIQFRTFDLEDVDLDILAGELLELLAQLVHLSTTFADDHSRAGSVDGNGNELQGTFDHDLRNTRFLQAGHQILADMFILHQLLGIVVPAVPVAIPTLDIAKA